MRIGDYYTFVPAGFTGEKHGTVKQAQALPHKVTGTIVGINRAHRFCRVRFNVNGVILHECFKIKSLEDRHENSSSFES